MSPGDRTSCEPRRRRRSLLACCGAGLAALAGCSGITARRDGARDTTTSSSPPGSPERRRVNGVRVPMPRSAFVRGAARDGIAAIVDPAFGVDWSGVSMEVTGNFGIDYVSKPRLTPSDRVVGVERDEEARAYPLRLLNWHEVVNDDLGGPLLVTYCPLCASGVTAVRRVGSAPTVFGVSGLLYRNALVLYDRATDSLWSQVATVAVRGPATGETLELVPSTLTTWGEWREAHPDTVVLRPPPDSGTVGDAGPANYDEYPYGSYPQDDRIGLAGSYQDDRLHPKTTVVGVASGGAAVAYPLPAVREAGVVEDRVGDLPVVVAATAEGTLVAYDRRVDGRALRFEQAAGGFLRGDGSRWRLITGRAVDGPHGGTTLQSATDASPMFFFAWKDFNPETRVYDG